MWVPYDSGVWQQQSNVQEDHQSGSGYTKIGPTDQHSVSWYRTRDHVTQKVNEAYSTCTLHGLKNCYKLETLY